MNLKATALALYHSAFSRPSTLSCWDLLTLRQSLSENTQSCFTSFLSYQCCLWRLYCSIFSLVSLIRRRDWHTNIAAALMSDSYERIQDQADVQFQFLRAGILLEQESFFSASDFDDQKKFPKHLHVLLPKGENQPLSAASQWQGVLHAVKNSIHEQVACSSLMLRLMCHKMEEHVKVLKEQVRALETQQQSLKKQIVKQDQQRADQFAKIDKLLEGQSTLMKKLGVKANEDTAEESEPE